MEERHEIVELLRDNSKDSLEEIVTTLDINPRSYNKSQLAVIIFLFNVGFHIFYFSTHLTSTHFLYPRL